MRGDTLVGMPEVNRGELARQVVVNLGAGLAAGYAGPLAGALATGAAPAVLAGMDYISATIGSRRVEHATETLEDAADAYGAETPEEFVEFVKAAVSDEDRQELLARALTIAQDAAFRDKRRALGRALAAAASDTGTKVDEEMLFIRVVAELDEPHIRLLRLMSIPPPSLDALNRQQRLAIGEPPIRQWHPPEIAQVDPGLAEVMYGLFPVLHRLRLIDGNEAEYTINAYGEWILARFAEPESQ
jgi:hypothetical protein